MENEGVNKAGKEKDSMDNGSYEVIKSRLSKQGKDLSDRIVKLNLARKDVFGSIETKLNKSERILTENNCIARDMAPIEDQFIFGYNVRIGLKSKVLLSDVFSIYQYSNGAFIKQSLDLINDQEFIHDFDELYTYYKNTFFAKFTIRQPYLYMIFQTGKDPADIKVFKWSIDGAKLTYLDNRSDHEVRFENKNEFKYVKATRDDQRNGHHPHISILDKVFVETVGGDLTVKIEDNTETGKGIYSEPVEDPDQSLDDAEIYYADLDELIILKIRPYKEEEFRYFIYNHKLKTVVRADAVKNTCVLLPGNHGIIFPKGYYLKNGDYKIFDVEDGVAVFDERVCSTNGEDCQYIFYNMNNGTYFIYSYNVIEQTIDTPIICCGYAHFSNGEMLIFKQEDEPQKNHMLQVWQTPYTGKNFVPEGNTDSYLFKIGIQDVVNAMADCSGICKLIQKEEGYQSIYLDLVKECERILDTYYWLDHKEAYQLKEILLQIRETAVFAVGEFEKVLRLKESAKRQVNEVNAQTEELLSTLTYGSFTDIDDYVKVLGKIRSLRGTLATVKELAYADKELLSSLEEKVREKNEEFSKQCVSFLMTKEGLQPYEQKIAALKDQVAKVVKSSEGKALLQKMDETSAELELLIDIVSNFKIDDPTMTTQIIEKISYLFSMINNSKATLTKQIDEITKQEMTQQFAAQMKLLGQTVVNFLDIADTVEKCDEYLNKVMVLIQELEGRFAQFNDYVQKIQEKREELYDAFESKKQTILDQQNKKLLSLAQSADRILNGIENRLKKQTSIEAIQSYLATDLMVEKVRDIIHDLTQLKDTVKADELTAKLKTISEESVRQLKDKQELYTDGDNVITLGKHSFLVNTKPVDLSIVPKDGALYFHITGTDFWEEIKDSGFEQKKDIMSQTVVSENNLVYRGCYLAYLIFCQARDKKEVSIDMLSMRSEAELVEIVQKFMEPRYQESYTKGVHDLDAAKLLKVLLEVHQKIDLLIYSNDARAFARFYWTCLAGESTKKFLKQRMAKLNNVVALFQKEPDIEQYVPYVEQELNKVKDSTGLFLDTDVYQASSYLCLELMKGNQFVVSKEAADVYEGFQKQLREKNLYEQFVKSLSEAGSDISGLYYYVSECVRAYDDKIPDGVAKEAAVMLLKPLSQPGRIIYMESKITVSGLIGSHPTISAGNYEFEYTAFMKQMAQFTTVTVKEYQSFTEMKKQWIAAFKAKIHLDDYRPKVLTSFVRNRLIDKVYLPLIGDNLAKQIGAAGEKKRTDLMGLLLLLSPPGYGKTTLMEYIANMLGIILVKINGPSLGNQVISLDPEKASNTAAKEELKKLNIALKMGNNVMIYLDDIQHCNTEFLQKFISLCDGQRKIDGVYDGVGQTYHLQGKKVAVVMAGNPYTESGEKFKIPDMLANRADVYNLGDMLLEDEEAFRLSYLENALTSNTVLSRLATGNTKDLYGLAAMAQGTDREDVTLTGSYSADELSEYVSVIAKLCKVRDIVLKVNLEYIHSAAQAEEYRKEPAFLLQGSYRNMNKIAQQIVPVMNDEELMLSVLSSYENDSQTLTSGAESNLLKFKELIGIITEEEKKRYEEILEIYRKNKLVKGDDKLGQAVLALSSLTEQMAQIKEILATR